MRVDQIIAYHAAQRPDHLALALSLGQCTLSYAQLNTRARQVANGLRAQGVGVGDRVAIVGENSIAHVVLTHGHAM